MNFLQERVMYAVIGGLVRHGLTAAGLATLVGGDDFEKAVGSVTFLIGLGWSIYQNWKKAKAVAQ